MISVRIAADKEVLGGERPYVGAWRRLETSSSLTMMAAVSDAVASMGMMAVDDAELRLVSVAGSRRVHEQLKSIDCLDSRSSR